MVNNYNYNNRYLKNFNNSEFYNYICECSLNILYTLKYYINYITNVSIFHVDLKYAMTNEDLYYKLSKFRRYKISNIKYNLILDIIYNLILNIKLYLISVLNYIFSNIYKVNGNTLTIISCKLPYCILLLIYCNNITTICFLDSYFINLPDQITEIKVETHIPKDILYFPLKLIKFETQSYNFDQRLDNLPNTLTSLCIKNNNSFNYPMNNLPASLTHLTILKSLYDQQLNNLPNILFLIIDEMWRTPFINLPQSIIYIEMSYYNKFQIGIRYVYPKQLKYLIIKSMVENSCNLISLCDIPDLIYLKLENCINYHLFKSQQIISNIKYIHFDDGIKILPHQLPNSQYILIIPKSFSKVYYSKLNRVVFKNENEINFNYSSLDNYGKYIHDVDYTYFHCSDIIMNNFRNFYNLNYDNFDNFDKFIHAKSLQIQ